MVATTKESGLEVASMDMGSMNGPVVQSMKATMFRTKDKARES
jgi:hypothetical protein